MRNGLIGSNACIKLITGVLALAVAGLSPAQTLVGGGATLPSIGYVGGVAANPSIPQVSGSNVNALSLFGVALGTGVSYCLTGSGSGKNILAGIAGGSVQNTCPTAIVNGVLVHGFGAPAVGRTDLIQPNFVGADAPLSVTDYSNYIIHHGANQFPVQFPAIAGSIAIAFNLRDNTGAQVTSSEVNFSDAQLCQIFSGKVTNWDQVAGAFTLPAGHSIPANPINVQYRSDGSGTTFALSNHLSVACNTIINPLETSQNFFSTTAAIPYVVQNFFGGTTHPALPINWTGSSSDSGVANAVLNTINSIGYVETANALATLPNLQIADVNGTSPVSNFGSQLTFVASFAANTNDANIGVINGVISGANNMDGTAAISLITNPPSTKCILLIRPDKYAAPGNSSRVSLLPLGSYPIVAVSYLLANNVGNGTDLVNMRNLLIAPYNSIVISKVKTIGPGTGLAFLNPTPPILFTSSQISGCLIN